MKLKAKEDNSWLLIKHNDEFAVHKEYNSEKETPVNSPINKSLKENKQPQKKKFYKALKSQARKLNSYIKPMLAKETGKPFNDKEWQYEIKWDGYRAIGEINKSNIELYSRNGNSFNLNYPIVINELKKIKQEVILDGEIVVLDEKGKSDFQQLQDYENNSSYTICYYVFDLLSINEKKIYDLPLIERKKLLRKIIPKNPVIKYSDYILENGIDLFAEAKKQNLGRYHCKKNIQPIPSRCKDK